VIYTLRTSVVSEKRDFLLDHVAALDMALQRVDNRVERGDLCTSFRLKLPQQSMVRYCFAIGAVLAVCYDIIYLG
jgi:hypothetical protein